MKPSRLKGKLGEVNSISYSAWSQEVFEERIAPFLKTRLGPALASECGPGLGPGQHRLYPGSLFLLWVQAIGGPCASSGAEPVAAALEMLHNASLVHDDVIDGHVFRHGQATLLREQGHNFAVLAGDALFASAMIALTNVDAHRLPGLLGRLGHAAADMITGQMNDEPGTWSGIKHSEQREQHWIRICLQKLALGNVSASLAAFWCNRTELESSVRVIMDEFSIVSQIINDFGDLFSYAGYHDLSASGRPPGEESSRKPTLPLIWAHVDSPEQIGDLARLQARAQQQIEQRRTSALAALEQLQLHPDAHAILDDFITRPSLAPIA